ncbi:fumarylacetoacetate hydrolase family protein [Brevundimonas sp.]|uniref:fumarylacetoacetate hydrolase family protein n=1 Tax=Brevundimonas sp. TaxID=1871086 RepID=UPI002D679E06|nr:fumarylacetoacetate hydrolase family protein [Brevundimonas sp.]HYC97206.1 fumarylacetoacetate hydrolase family protein [Brevundimonas sp.]
MKLLRYGPAGSERPGLLDARGDVRDLSGVVDDLAGEALSPDSLARLSAIDPASLSLVADPGRIGPCVGRVGKFICIGLNYADHAAETGATVPDEPILFMKATSAIVGPDDDVIQPRDSTKLDWEVELGVVIGSTARYVSEAEALDHVAGYCVINDVSERAFQLERGGTWDKGKGCDTFGPIGPWLVTKDEAGDVGDLSMWLEVNGRRFQDGSSRTMVFGPAVLVSYVSRFMSLQPGDIISTGTPPGVGMGQKPPVWLQPGDVIELGIQGLGRQRQRVVAQGG